MSSTPLDRAARGWLDHLRVERGLSPHTLKAYGRDISRYLTYLAGLGVRDPKAIDEAYDRVVHGDVRYRVVIDTATIGANA